MSDFDRIEARREQIAGLDYEARIAKFNDDTLAAVDSFMEREAYEPDDPKSEGFHERYADHWDMREKCP